jgi:outer membrane immunogenic protein
MRWWVCGLLIAIAFPALAADYDDSWLRGSQTVGPSPGPPPRLYRIWTGVYGGAQVGEDWHGVDFRQLPTSQLQNVINQDAILNSISAALPNMQDLPQINTRGPSYGGFVGYNWQIDDVVFGAELNANRSALHQSASSTVSRNYIITSGGNTYAPTNVTVAGSGTVDMSTYGTIRGRLGWAMGNFLPYMVAGVAFAQVDSSGLVDISYHGKNVTPPNCNVAVPVVICPNIGANYPFANVSHGKYELGWDAALGLDYMMTRNVFLRGEVEYLWLGTPNNIRLNTLSARTAVGLRF